jgi:hypothetical protein
MIIRISPIAIQPLPIDITIQLEHIRIAIRVSFVKRAIYVTALLICVLAKENKLYFTRDLKSTSALHQVYLFLDK